MRTSRRTGLLGVIVLAATAAAGAIADGAVASTSERTQAAAVVGDHSPAKKTPHAPPPAAPTNVHITKVGPGYVELAWAPSTDDGGLPIRVYRMLELRSGRAKMATADPGPDGLMRGRFKGLPPMVPVTFAVVARTRAGVSEQSEQTPVVVPYPALKVLPRTLPEGASSPRIAISVEDPLSVPVDVRVRALEDSGAEAGVDYEPFDTVVTLPAHARSVQVPIPIIDDDKAEGNEALQIELSVVDIEESVLVETIRIIDDDRTK